MPHDPQRHVAYLRQALESDKRPLALLLGAGCPLAIRIEKDGGSEPLIPDIDGLMTLTDKEFEGSAQQGTYVALKAQLGAPGAPPLNIETLLNHIRALKVVAGGGEVRGVTGEQLDAVEELLCQTISAAVNKPLPSDRTPFHQVAAWVGGILRHEAVELFTTNYDLLMEQALEDTRTPFFDGFVGARYPFFDVAAIENDELPPRWARLWKVHGSISWSIDSRGTVVRAPSAGARLLIYPTHLKYEQSRRMPYLAMLDRLKTFLRRPSAVLACIGYSFRDDHINEVIVQGLQGNPTAIAFGLMYDGLAKYEVGRTIAETRVNLTLLARDGAVVATRPDTYVTGESAEQTGVKTTANATGSVTTVTLGDFQVFAQFLQELVGHQRIVVES